MTEIFWVEDFMSGEVMDHRYYQTREEAVARSNEMGYGLVKSFELQDGGTFRPGCGRCLLGSVGGPCGRLRPSSSD